MTPAELAAIRERDAEAGDCAVGWCRDPESGWAHKPCESGCLWPADHHTYERGEPEYETDRDRRALLAELDRLREAIRALPRVEMFTDFGEGETLGDWIEAGAVDAALGDTEAGG